MNSSIDIIRDIAKRVIDKTPFELVHVEFGSTSGRKTLRIYIDRKTGITHGDCAMVSEEMERLLDLEDLISGEYFLEVSSPGIERGLYSLGDFERFQGRPAKIKTYQAVGGQKNFRGIIRGISDDSVLLEDLTTGEKAIEFENIKKANLEFDATEELKQPHDKGKRDR